MFKRDIVVQSAGEMPKASLVDALNAAYADYYVPIRLTEDSFDELVHRESVSLSASAAALKGNRIIGIGLLGIRGHRAWIGGMGVLPRFRKQGVGRRLMEYLINKARAHNLSKIQLEVLSQNKPAQRLYQSIGFRTKRSLSVMVDEAAQIAHKANGIFADVIIKSCSPTEALTYCTELSSADPPWQREPRSLEPIIDRLHGLAAYRTTNDSVCGACLYNGEIWSVGLLDIAATDTVVGNFLLAYLRSKYPSARISYMNVAQDDPLIPALFDAGFTEAMSQYEMHLSISQDEH